MSLFLHLHTKFLKHLDPVVKFMMTPVRDRIPPILAYLRILQEPGVNRTFGFLLPKKCLNRHGGPQSLDIAVDLRRWTQVASEVLARSIGSIKPCCREASWSPSSFESGRMNGLNGLNGLKENLTHPETISDLKLDSQV
jgi:hypothetical protein